MKIELRIVQPDEKETLHNLWQYYDYDFSQFDQSDVNDTGSFDCKDLNYYWIKEKKWMYFIIVDSKLAGFVMLTDIPEIEGTEIDWTIGEFFVMRKYRRLGVGRQSFLKILDLHKGKIYLRRHPKNTASVSFWDNIIEEYAKGKYVLIKSHPDIAYRDGTLADVFFFNA